MPEQSPRYTVGELAQVAGVTVRTLHHYDDIGLLSPSGRTSSGYRVYVIEDLERLQRIRFYRELEFSLPEIIEILASDQDPADHLRRQRELIRDRIDHFSGLLATLDKTLEARRMGINLNPREMFEVFGEDDPTRYAEEAEQRWGDTDAWRESTRRTSSYTKADWQRIQAEQAANQQRFAELMTAGTPPASPESMLAAEEHRLLIDRYFYPLDHAMHVTLGQMYVDDPRFTATYDAVAVGLGSYIRDAIIANADRAAR